MRFLLDMNLPPAIADWLRVEGHDAVHIRKIAEAAKQDRVVVTFDLDFGEIAGLAGAKGAKVVLLRLRLARQQFLRHRLQVVIAQAAEALAYRVIQLMQLDAPPRFPGEGRDPLLP